MKAKEVVQRIAESEEYAQLVHFWELIGCDPNSVTAEVILAPQAEQRFEELFEAVKKLVDKAIDAFLEEVTRSSRPKEAPELVPAGALEHAQEVIEALARQIRLQMPAYCKALKEEMATERKSACLL